MSLLASLLTSSSTLSVFDRSVEVTQNNVTNATTPGYVTQRLTLDALPFDPGLDLPGGVRAGDVQSARNEFAEAAGELYLSALVEIGLVLFAITLIVNSLSRVLIWSMARSSRATVTPEPAAVAPEAA